MFSYLGLEQGKAQLRRSAKQFIAHFERYENKKDAGLDSVRFVSTNLTADQLSDDLRKKLDNNDRIIVTKLVSGNHQGWLDKTVWDWINAVFSLISSRHSF